VALPRLSGSIAVALNRAVAVTERDGPAAGPAALDAMRRLGETAQARDASRRALELAPTAPERRLLVRRLAEMPPL